MAQVVFSWSSLAAGLLLAGFSALSFGAAMMHLSPVGSKNEWRILFRWRWFISPENFTPEGLGHYRKARSAAVGAILFFVLHVIISMC